MSWVKSPWLLPPICEGPKSRESRPPPREAVTGMAFAVWFRCPSGWRISDTKNTAETIVHDKMDVSKSLDITQQSNTWSLQVEARSMIGWGKGFEKNALNYLG